jgi:hypothetical protein
MIVERAGLSHGAWLRYACMTCKLPSMRPNAAITKPGNSPRRYILIVTSTTPGSSRFSFRVKPNSWHIPSIVVFSRRTSP